MKTEAMYGEPPTDMGLIDLSPVEMMFWMYCPIKVPGSWDTVTPDNLRQFSPIVSCVFRDCKPRWRESYVYITAKTLWTSPENPGNRPGWHSDGFLTDDLNYVWSDRAPTLFWTPQDRVAFTADHVASLTEMDGIAEWDEFAHRVYPDKHLLRLDERVIHKVDNRMAPGMRTFVKVSVSNHQYRLEGNSINHGLGALWPTLPRSEQRNCPIGEPVHA